MMEEGVVHVQGRGRVPDLARARDLARVDEIIEREVDVVVMRAAGGAIRRAEMTEARTEGEAASLGMMTAAVKLQGRRKIRRKKMQRGKRAVLP